MFRDLRLAWKIKTALINENRELNYSEMLLLEKIGEKKTVSLQERCFSH